MNLYKGTAVPIPDCVFCTELVLHHEVEVRGTAAAFPDEFPVSQGHTLIVPRRHVVDLFDLSDTELGDIWQLLKSVRQRLGEADSAIRGYNIGVNNGAVAGQTVPHAHVHVIPRRPGDTDDPRGGVRGVIPHQMSY
jgi:diadenosine tetraphosphate (Ap4A) HIT family hydrolase